MIQQIIILVGFIGVMDALFNKWGVWRKIEKITAEKMDFEFIFKLGQCRFCLSFHFSAIIYIILYALGAFSCLNLEVLIASNGLIHLFKRNGL